MKRCPRCEQEKDESLFGLDKSRANGLSAYCKQCTNARHRKSSAITGIKKPRRVILKETLRQRSIVKYGIDLVETLDSLGGYQEERF